ncbi:MAG: hypothetical protein ACYTFW_17855, partial [Planctomycetota bacterium]
MKPTGRMGRFFLPMQLFAYFHTIGAIHRTLIWNDLCQPILFSYSCFFTFSFMTLPGAGCFDDESF